MPDTGPVYLNACSHGLPSAAVLDAVADHTGRERHDGPVTAFRNAAERLEVLYDRAGRILGAPPSEIDIAATTTSAWLGVVLRLNLVGRRILVAPHEWGPNVRMLERLAASAAASIEVLPDPTSGAPLSDWAARFDEDVAAIFTPMVSSIEGRRYPVEEIADVPRPEGCRLIVDGAQAIGQTDIDLGGIPCDAFLATTRKWVRAPRGTALAWVNPALGAPRPPRDIEPTDMPVSAHLALSEALGEALDDGIAARAVRIGHLRDLARAGARERGFDVLHGHEPMTGALALFVPQRYLEDVKTGLQASDVVVKFPDPERDEPASPPVTGGSVLRVSPHIYNTEAEIECMIEALPRIA
ncbi:aminotransferase class V-fold PLP-dependent enzyme [Ovoidimarina sediminis]|uniref:aminotransferase class V-fold PLP-dependent enzyme n=1 Tax=Ovoidimarina sediminis TaxID=3079856 RepID=UPI0029135992|nr:aminotransferase class V-fold PLP-dependent enzyme [Rhodophyticola sp. MJ-SS7]MDU8945387.1 aminotransferase class V-fold PLP-dependent enzyme [Rhodophyticola sp. MJ-SS7]